jgi:hypothetical protein
MNYTKTLTASLAAIALLTLNSATAFAQNEGAWVSSAGNGTACTRTAPCADFMDAYNGTMAGGAIGVLDSGIFGPISINKSLTVRAIGVIASPTVDGNPDINLVTVNVSPSDTVVLDGLSFVAGGIRINGAGTVIIRNCRIGFDGITSYNNFGILIAPSGPLQVVISDTTVENNGNTGGGAGVWVLPQQGGSARVTLERVTASHNQFGVAIDGSQSAAGINLTIKDSNLSANVNDGLVATTSSSHAPIGVLVSNTSSTNNAYGIRSIGSGVTVRVKNSEIAGNGAGLAASAGGALLTYGNNNIDANGSNGVFTGSVALK